MVLRACLGAGALALLLATSGCSDDPQPRVEPTADSPAPSPSETTSAEPAAWEVKSKAGAVAFAQHWIDLFNSMLDSGDPEAFLKASHSKCGICQDFAERIEGIHSSGGFYEGDDWRVLQVAQPKLWRSNAIVPMTIREGAERYRESPSDEVVRHRAMTATWSVQLTRERDAWLVTDFRVVE
ncbi:DUF6318 family protein [Nocardioides taihuensis]|uniref:DUF6318 family protein n=1 Tax=Nocardioides taihuensis TaxID=1835606 RepID=A0ABW0BKL4_9ACTN